MLGSRMKVRLPIRSLIVILESASLLILLSLSMFYRSSLLSYAIANPPLNSLILVLCSGFYNLTIDAANNTNILNAQSSTIFVTSTNNSMINFTLILDQSNLFVSGFAGGIGSLEFVGESSFIIDSEVCAYLLFILFISIFCKRLSVFEITQQSGFANISLLATSHAFFRNVNLPNGSCK